LAPTDSGPSTQDDAPSDHIPTTTYKQHRLRTGFYDLPVELRLQILENCSTAIYNPNFPAEWWDKHYPPRNPTQLPVPWPDILRSPYWRAYRRAFRAFQHVSRQFREEFLWSWAASTTFVLSSEVFALSYSQLHARTRNPDRRAAVPAPEIWNSRDLSEFFDSSAETLARNIWIQSRYLMDAIDSRFRLPGLAHYVRNIHISARVSHTS
jgi:hypothetical protein